ncbi:MAG: sulfotransferase family protein [Beijerinckiaceae bacterium]|nr:sulfotransferase family protein [Beijerinckiaceae bacterium]
MAADQRHAAAAKVSRLARAKVQTLCTLAGVYHYDDVFEKFIRWNKYTGEASVLFARRIHQVIRQRQVLFIHVPKNAGTSISTAVYGCTLGHKTAFFYRKADLALFEGAKRFAVLREPIERFLSAYSFIQNGGGEHVVVNPRFSPILKKLKTVDSTLDFVEENMSDIYQIVHVLRPQSWFIMDMSGNLLIENIFILGVHDKELGQFLNRLDVTGLQVLNRTQRWPIVLTPSQMDRVQRIYQLDSSLIAQVRTCGPEIGRLHSVRRKESLKHAASGPFSGEWVTVPRYGV